jgi:fucose permease
VIEGSSSRTTIAPHTRVLTGIAHAGMFVFGIVMALVGAVVPTLTGSLALTPGQVGTLFLAMNFAMLVGSLVVGLVMDRYGLKRPLAAGAATVGTGLILMAAAADSAMLFLAVACLGLGGAALNAGTNTLVADLHDDPARKAAALNLLGVFFGFGALVLPFSIGALTSRVGVAPLLFAASVLCGALTFTAGAVPFPAPKRQHGLPFRELPALVRMPVVRVLALLLFFQSGNEFLLGGYLATFLTRERQLDVAGASYVLAAFWASIMIARVVLSRALAHIDAMSVVIGGAWVAAVAVAIMALAPGADVPIAGAVLAGLALAGIFPGVLGFTGVRFREHSGAVFGILFTAALCGGMTIPWIAGQLADAAGLRWVFALAAFDFAAVASLAAVARRAAPQGPRMS